MRHGLGLLSGALALLAPLSAQSLLVTYLVLPGITGEGQPPGPPGSIEVLDFAIDEGLQQLTIVKPSDASSPALALAVAQGTVFETALLQRFDPALSPVPLEQLRFDLVLISSFVVLPGPGEIPDEQVTLAYAEGPFPVPEPGDARIAALLGLGLLCAQRSISPRRAAPPTRGRRHGSCRARRGRARRTR